jgi:hypothetical protein
LDVVDILKGGDKLLRNDNGKFVDVSEAAGIYGSLIGFGLGVTVGDVNGDLYPDIYISNDFTKRIIYTSIIKMEPLPNKYKDGHLTLVNLRWVLIWQMLITMVRPTYL